MIYLLYKYQYIQIQHVYIHDIMYYKHDISMYISRYTTYIYIYIDTWVRIFMAIEDACITQDTLENQLFVEIPEFILEHQFSIIFTIICQFLSSNFYKLKIQNYQIKMGLQWHTNFYIFRHMDSCNEFYTYKQTNTNIYEYLYILYYNIKYNILKNIFFSFIKDMIRFKI